MCMLLSLMKETPSALAPPGVDTGLFPAITRDTWGDPKPGQEKPHLEGLSSWRTQKTFLWATRLCLHHLQAVNWLIEWNSGLEENFKSEVVLPRMTLPVKSPLPGFVLVILFNVRDLVTPAPPDNLLRM
ncbi:Hypothetical predicted protein [Marmota monax]|uniref:Uncharacterized protein n=1 Tax=Marmota monax TaxID=9995 RepID=A0A5E4AB69_MARMO|nr:Hypothetical predicted protein [Marmota monax]